MINIGDAFEDLKYGDADVQKVCLGSEIIWEKSSGGLPSGYTEVKYLQSSGTQYINTGKGITSATDIQFKIKYNTGGVGWARPIGTMLNATGNMLVLQMHTYYGYWHVRIDNSTSVGQDINRNNFEMTIKTEGRNVYMNDSLIGTFSKDKPSVGYPIYLFNSNNRGTPYNVVSNNFSIYNYQKLENGVIEQNFIPCLDRNNVPCFFDMVSRQTFYNAGTGTFGYETLDGTVVNPT